MAAKQNKEKFLMYKGKPLVRSGNTIYYGNSYDPFVILINVVSTKKVGDLDVADRVSIQLLNTDPNVRPRERIVKKSEKNLKNLLTHTAMLMYDTKVPAWGTCDDTGDCSNTR